MNKTLQNIIAFLAGAGISSVVTWQLLKKKYAQMAQEEIDSVKEVFSKKNKPDIEKIEETQECVEGEEYDEEEVVETPYSKILTDLQYTSSNETRGDKMKGNGIYVIPPDDFDEVGYETVSLTYYADGVLAYDGSDEIVEDIDDVVGSESLNTFGEYEDDSVFVRNDELKIDYEILLDKRNYSDVVGIDPQKGNE